MGGWGWGDLGVMGVAVCVWCVVVFGLGCVWGGGRGGVVFDWVCLGVILGRLGSVYVSMHVCVCVYVCVTERRRERDASRGDVRPHNERPTKLKRENREGGGGEDERRDESPYPAHLVCTRGFRSGWLFHVHLMSASTSPRSFKPLKGSLHFMVPLDKRRDRKREREIRRERRRERKGERDKERERER